MPSIRLSALGNTQVTSGRVTVSAVRVVSPAPGSLVLADGFDGTAQTKAVIDCGQVQSPAYALSFPNGLVVRLQGGAGAVVEVDYA